MPRSYYTATCEIKKGEEIMQRLELKEQQVVICECSSSWKIRQSREIMTRSDTTDQILYKQGWQYTPARSMASLTGARG